MASTTITNNVLEALSQNAQHFDEADKEIDLAIDQEKKDKSSLFTKTPSAKEVAIRNKVTKKVLRSIERQQKKIEKMSESEAQSIVNSMKAEGQKNGAMEDILKSTDLNAKEKLLMTTEKIGMGMIPKIVEGAVEAGGLLPYYIKLKKELKSFKNEIVTGSYSKKMSNRVPADVCANDFVIFGATILTFLAWLLFAPVVFFISMGALIVFAAVCLNETYKIDTY